MTRRNTTQATSRYRSASPKDGAGMIQPRLWALFLLMGALMLTGPVGAAERRSSQTTATRTSSVSSRSESSAARSKSDDRRREAAAAQRKAEERRSAASAEQRKADERRREAAAEQRKAEQQKAEERKSEERRSEAAAAQRNADERRSEAAASQRISDQRRSDTATGQRNTDQRRSDTATGQRQAGEQQNRTGRGTVSNGVNRNDDNSRVNPDNRGQNPEQRGRDIRYEGPSRSEVRYYQFATHKTGHRYNHDRERCNICFGVGYTYGHDHLHRLRCTHCMGRGFGIQFHVQLHDVCPLCYGSVNGYGFANRHHEMVDIARRMTQELDYVVRLSNSQERRIYRINLDYLRESRRGDLPYWIERRDNQIYRVLNNRQRPLYLAYARNIDYRDVCDNCFAVYF